MIYALKLPWKTERRRVISENAPLHLRELLKSMPNTPIKYE
jgi:hypothetical protein